MQKARRKGRGTAMEGKRDNWFKTIWRLFYPLLLHFGIMILVSTIWSVVVYVLVVEKNWSAGEASMIEHLQEMAYQAMEGILRSTYYITLVADLIVLPFLYLFFRQDKKQREKVEPEIKYGHASPAEYLLLAVVAFGACIGFNGLIAGLGLIEVDETYQEVSELLYSASLPMQLFGTALVVPLCEEFMFRGLMYNRLKENMSAGMAMITASMVFGLYHGNMVQMLYAFPLSCMMIYAYEKYHSFLAPILFHVVANGVAVLITGTDLFDFLFSGQIMRLLTGGVGLAVVYGGLRIIRDTVKLEPVDPASKVEL